MYKPEELTDTDGLMKERQGTPENTDVQRGPQCHSQLSTPRQCVHTSKSQYPPFLRGLHHSSYTGAPLLPPGTWPP